MQKTPRGNKRIDNLSRRNKSANNNDKNVNDKSVNNPNELEQQNYQVLDYNKILITSRAPLVSIPSRNYERRLNSQSLNMELSSEAESESMVFIEAITGDVGKLIAKGLNGLALIVGFSAKTIFKGVKRLYQEYNERHESFERETKRRKIDTLQTKRNNYDLFYEDKDVEMVDVDSPSFGRSNHQYSFNEISKVEENKPHLIPGSFEFEFDTPDNVVTNLENKFMNLKQPINGNINSNGEDMQILGESHKPSRRLTFTPLKANTDFIKQEPYYGTNNEPLQTVNVIADVYGSPIGRNTKGEQLQLQRSIVATTRNIRSPNVKYGTTFDIIDDSPAENKPESNGSNNNNNGYIIQDQHKDVFATRLRNAFMGTYEPPPTIIPELKTKKFKSYRDVIDNAYNVLQNKLTPSKFKSSILNHHQNLKSPITTPSKFSPSISDTLILAFPNKYKSYDEILSKKLKLQEAIKELKLEIKKEILKPLNKEQLIFVNKIWNNYDSINPIIDSFRIQIYLNDILTLKDGKWLNDNIIDFYLSLIVERSQLQFDNDKSLPKIFAYSTHFYTSLENNGYQSVARWGKRKKLDVKGIDYILIPVNRSNTHWCLSRINIKDKQFEFYDSLGGKARKVFDNLKEYMIKETEKQYPGYNPGYENWNCIDMECEQQLNGYDCGVFTCKNSEVLARDGDLNGFSQSDMRGLRRRMVWEITNKKMLS